MSTPNDAQVGGLPKSNLRKPLDPGFKRNLKIIGAAMGGFALVIVGLLWWSSRSGNVQYQSNMQDAGMVVQNDAPMPKRYQDKVNRVETAESRQAAANGQSYIPQPSNDPPTSYGQAIGNQAATVQPVQPPVQPSGYVQPPNGQGNNAEPPKGLMDQLKRLADANTPSKMVEIDAMKLSTTGTGAAGSSGATGAANGASGPAVSRTMIVDKEYIASAQVENRPSTDRGGDTYVKINGGVLEGAELQGSSSLYNSEYMKTHFTTMTFKGKTYDIDATALDETTAEEALDGKIDHKILDRYVMPVIFAGVQAFANAKAQTGSFAAVPVTPTTSNGTTVVSSYGIATNPPDTTQAINAGVAQGLSVANQNISKMATEPPDVSLPQNTAIGVRFNAPVYEK